MKLRTIYTILFSIIYFNFSAQITSSQGSTDEKGLKQGEWVFHYEKHPLIADGGKATVICYYKNDTLCGKYNIYNKDSTWQYVLNAEDNDIKGFGYLLINNKVRKTFFYFNINNCLVTEYDKKGKLYRTYELQDNLLNKNYTVYKNGKVIINRLYRNNEIIENNIK